MAGAGYKLFNTGDVLTAAQVNTYLQEQVVMVFANAAARTTALSGVLAEGMVSYLKDTNATEVYDGSAWVGIGNSGDITGITTGATSGLTGGVTSGTADLKLNTTAKGGLLVGTGSGTVSELAVGSNTQVLTADSTTSTGLKWAAAASSDLKGVSLYNTTDQTITTSTNTIVNFNSEYYDTDTFHDTVTNNSRITIPSGLGGKYLITGMVQWAIGATGQRRLRILKNGSYAVPNGFQDSVTASNVTEDTNLLVVSIELVAGDYIELSVWQNAGGNRTVGGSTNGYGTLFSAIRIAA